MKTVRLSKEQVTKLTEMFVELYLKDEFRDELILFLKVHWLKICLYDLLPRVAEVHGKQPYTTPAWSEHMVRQKVINDLPTINPVDTLYDIWKHPEKYAQEL